MVFTPERAIVEFDAAVTDYGTTVTAKFFAISGIATTGSEYDDVSYLTVAQSGSAVSGVAIVQPLSRDTAGNDYKMVEQGILRFDDRKIFVTGSLMNPMPANSKVRFVIGTKTWELLPEGMRPWDVSGTTVYWSGFIREKNVT